MFGGESLEWLIPPLLILFGVIVSEARRWSSDKRTGSSEQVSANADELTAQVLLIKQLHDRLERVEAKADLVPGLSTRLDVADAENKALREYVARLIDILSEHGIEVPELVWPYLELTAIKEG